MNVFSTHLQDNFDALPPLLQRAHQGSVLLSGRARIERGNAVAHIMCKLFGFPRAGNDVPLTVACTHTEDQMEWHRNFDGQKMHSRFTRNGDFLVEHLGPLSMTLSAEARSGQLYYCFKKIKFLGLPVPQFLAPNILAFEEAVDGFYHFKVDVRMLLVGRVIAYSGVLDVKTQ